MASTKMKIAAGAGVVAVIVGVIAMVAMKSSRNSGAQADAESWRSLQVTGQMLESLPAQVKVAPTKFASGQGRRVRSNGPSDPAKVAGVGVSLREIVALVYRESPSRILFYTLNPEARYDFVSTQPPNPKAALKQELARQLKFTATIEQRTVPVLSLRVKRPNAAGLKPNPATGGSESRWDAGEMILTDASMEELASTLEDQFGVPVIDRTGIAGNFDMHLKYEQPNRVGWEKALLDELGLELVSGEAEVKVLVVRK